MLWRERALLDRLPGLFQHVLLVTYGGPDDLSWAGQALPSARPDALHLITNEAGLEPGVFQAEVPERVGEMVRRLGIRSAVVHTDQHFGGDVGVAIARELRSGGVRTGLVARGGYPWAWCEAMEHGPESVPAQRAAVRERELCAAADVIVGTTPLMVRDLAVRHALPWDRLRVIPNYVVVHHEPPPIRERQPGTVLFAGRLDPQKRVDLLIRGVSAARDRVPGVRLCIIGQGRLRPELERLASDLGVPAEFRPRVPHDELMNAMRRARVYAQCSHYEGHPKTIIEALAHGVPTLVTRAPGVDDEVENERTGLVVAPDPRRIGDALVRLLTDEPLAQRLGMEAARDARSRLTIDAIAPEHARAWSDALARGGSMSSVPVVGVRWDAQLLRVDPERSAEEFAAALHAFARRLDPDARSRFLAAYGRQAPTTPAGAV